MHCIVYGSFTWPNLTLGDLSCTVFSGLGQTGQNQAYQYFEWDSAENTCPRVVCVAFHLLWKSLQVHVAAFTTNLC